MTASTFTKYGCKKLLDAVLNQTSYGPSAIYIGLSTTDPGEDGSGLTEVTGGSYARVACTNSFPAAGDATNGGTCTSNADITFPQATANWGTVTHFFISEQAADGYSTMILFGALTTSKAVNNGDTAKFNSGSITITMD